MSPRYAAARCLCSCNTWLVIDREEHARVAVGLMQEQAEVVAARSNEHECLPMARRVLCLTCHVPLAGWAS